MKEQHLHHHDAAWLNGSAVLLALILVIALLYFR
jgi:hypothetical protein